MDNLFHMPPPPTLAQQLETMDARIQKLGKEFRHLKEDNARLAEERRQLRATVDKQREELKALQGQIKNSVIQISMGDSEAGSIRKQIDAYVEEIDRCIAHLAE